MDAATYSMVLFELLEYAPQLGGGRLEWDMVGWRGGDYNRLWIKSEGSVQPSVLSGGEAEFQALYGRLIAPFFDLQAGLRYDHAWRQGGQASRLLGVLGLQGLAPYWFEVEPVVFISPQGELSARLTASRELTLTQRTFLQARAEANAALQPVAAFGVGAGLNDGAIGLRLRHEFRREFAPYIGVTFSNRFGETAEFVRQRGEAPWEFSVVAGSRLWY
ncbi:MAG: copper resistance protein B [Candidatus Sericytochromatia bacterium]